MAKVSASTKNFLESNKEYSWMKDQIILKYPQPVEKKLVLQQVRSITGNTAVAGMASKIKVLDKEQKNYLVLVTGSHLWGEKEAYKVHNPPPMPVPGPPIYPEFIKNTLINTLSALKNSILTTAEKIRKS